MAIQRLAVVRADGFVENVVAADPEEYPSPEGCALVASDTAGPGDTYSGGVFTRPAPASDYPAEARAALDASDMTAIRCVKAGVAFPAEWQAYCATLRAIVNGAQTGPLPVRPDYPAGT